MGGESSGIVTTSKENSGCVAHNYCSCLNLLLLPAIDTTLFYCFVCVYKRVLCALVAGLDSR